MASSEVPDVRLNGEFMVGISVLIKKVSRGEVVLKVHGGSEYHVRAGEIVNIHQPIAVYPAPFDPTVRITKRPLQAVRFKRG